MIMQEQDKTIDSITGTVAVLTEQAGLMGQEIEEHMECVFTFDSFHVSPLLFCVSPLLPYILRPIHIPFVALFARPHSEHLRMLTYIASHQFLLTGCWMT